MLGDVNGWMAVGALTLTFVATVVAVRWRTSWSRGRDEGFWCALRDVSSPSEHPVHPAWGTGSAGWVGRRLVLTRGTRKRTVARCPIGRLVAEEVVVRWEDIG